MFEGSLEGVWELSEWFWALSGVFHVDSIDKDQIWIILARCVIFSQWPFLGDFWPKMQNFRSDVDGHQILKKFPGPVFYIEVTIHLTIWESSFGLPPIDFIRWPKDWVLRALLSRPVSDVTFLPTWLESMFLPPQDAPGGTSFPRRIQSVLPL